MNSPKIGDLIWYQTGFKDVKTRYGTVVSIDPARIDRQAIYEVFIFDGTLLPLGGAYLGTIWGLVEDKK
jgi:hypothetical protein